jgi:hypothetical protein
VPHDLPGFFPGKLPPEQQLDRLAREVILLHSVPPRQRQPPSQQR